MILLKSFGKKSYFLNYYRQFTSTHTFFDKFSKSWWDIDGDMSILHDYNQVRIPFIANSYLTINKDTSEFESASYNRTNNLFPFRRVNIFEEPDLRSSVHIESVLKGLNILDVGCGGGILTESLAKYGCKVLGIDPNQKLIDIAKSHKSQFFDNLHIQLGLRDNYSANLKYKATSVYDLLTEEHKGIYDIVVASEVIEHIDNREKEQFFEALTKFVKPGGLLVITTPGSSLVSYLFNVYLAENIFNKVPKDTHDFNLFITPKNCCKILSKLNFEAVLKQGLLYLPFLRRFFHINSCNLLYMYSFRNTNGVERVCT
ncbi:3-demethylubiquinone-9 3-methyltransferase-like protein [Theileria orientalis]|uniref:Ubiquinone biosynthesis O-methyltransferase, mitochondrial n=1 Tax=Theileria orientalis TaxID=68886 RepID=A0A976XIT6_THEOR|nr:3-demethylubiquinone-9 3-methyltransferase-like protein [Theileria orientalis]